MPLKRVKSPSSLSHERHADTFTLIQTHRTHEENQERAYIAASRRADRDIEHRIRSALKASECRKKRTGRGLKITREAVMGDEQYESEDDDPATRRFSMPATTSSALTNPYIPHTSRADRYAEVDALFAKHFPHIQLSSRWTSQTHPPAPPHSFSQPLHLQTTYVPRYHQQNVPVTQPSPLLTPPTSYPLPPNRDNTTSRSMSPLALETSPQPETTAPDSAAIGLGIPLADTYLLHDNTTTTTDPQHQPTFLYPDPTNPSWYNPTSGESAAARGWHHSRTHSLPASLAQFTFSFPSPAQQRQHHHHQQQHHHQQEQQDQQQQQQPTSATTTTTIATSADLDAALVDPSIIGSAAAASAAPSSSSSSSSSGSGSAGLSMTVDGTVVNESWADWVDLDGPGPGSGPGGEGQGVQVQGVQPQALGVAV
jgi:hypothetical protein